MKNKLHDTLVNGWAIAMITVITLGLLGMVITLAQWILRLVGVL